MRDGTSCHLNSQWTNLMSNQNQPLFKDLS